MPLRRGPPLLKAKLRAHREFILAQAGDQKLFVALKLRAYSHQAISLSVKTVSNVRVNQVTQLSPERREIDTRLTPIALGNAEPGGDFVFVLELTLPARPPGRVRIAQIELGYIVAGMGRPGTLPDADVIIEYTTDAAQAAVCNEEILQLVKQRNVGPISPSAMSPSPPNLIRSPAPPPSGVISPGGSAAPWYSATSKKKGQPSSQKASPQPSSTPWFSGTVPSGSAEAKKPETEPVVEAATSPWYRKPGQRPGAASGTTDEPQAPDA